MNSLRRLCRECGHMFVFKWDRNSRTSQLAFNRWDISYLIHKVAHNMGRMYGADKAKTNS